MKIPEKEKGDEIGIQLGIPLKIADRKMTCLVTKAESLEIEVQAIKDNLENIMIKAKDIFRKSSIQESLDFGSDMGPEQI